MSFRFDESNHTYWLGERQLVSVTQVLNLLGGYENVPMRKLQEAAARGSAVHLMTEYYDAGTLDIGALSDEMLGYWQAYRAFKREVSPEIFDVEVRGYHEKLFYAGTRDRCLAIKGKKGILDVKSSFMLMPTTAPQTAAYAEIYNQNLPKSEHAKKRWGLRLGKDGSYELKEYSDQVSDFNTFLSCYNIHSWAEKHNKELRKKLLQGDL